MVPWFSVHIQIEQIHLVPKSETSSIIGCFFRPVCVKPGRKPRRQVLSRGSNVGATSIALRATTVREGELIILSCNACYIAVVVRTCHLLYGQTIYCRCCTEMAIYCPKWRSNDYPHKATYCQHTYANVRAVYGWEMTCTTTTVALSKAEANVCPIYGWEMTCTTTTVALPKSEKGIVFFFNFTMNICFYFMASL